MNNIYCIVGFMLGATCTMLFMLSMVTGLKEENDYLRDRLRIKREKVKAEKSLRLDREIDLEDANEIIAYQRDELYRIKHPVKLSEYRED